MITPQMDFTPRYATETDYYLFGLGSRRKLIYQNATLRDALTGDVLYSWPGGTRFTITPEGGCVWFTNTHRTQSPNMMIDEGSSGVWVGNRGTQFSENGVHSVKMHGESVTSGRVGLCRFRGLGEYERPELYHPYDVVLKVLQREALFNIMDGAPRPNVFVYDRPHYREAAMICMVLEKTRNLHLVRDWILGLSDPFDRARGVDEPDNLGQLLYMISLVSDASHPLVPVVLDEAKRFRVGDHISGLTDSEPHPVYQTKWLKFGLRSLGLPDNHTIPPVYDSYSSLIWWAHQDEHIDGPRFDEQTRQRRPYLAWAEDHFYGNAPVGMDALMTTTYGHQVRRDVYTDRNQYIGPSQLTYEQDSPTAAYGRFAHVNSDDAKNRICRPHAWHAAEMFLHLAELGPFPNLDNYNEWP
ncbi:hypothetical protein CCAX7_008640 [Capsulimonas corticalis]|uniref:Uncharacterized protein n=1 Tax=Capsulimonas corticalis TaxID=2219043 RepID=A0A402CU03_9BACT|nr:hypothetical protein [Capsulimonas corticalis]BDI28813.1 hypothetical protein CCAX7_008640 [Capsulimonas corticalis]